MLAKGRSLLVELHLQTERWESDWGVTVEPLSFDLSDEADCQSKVGRLLEEYLLELEACMKDADREIETVPVLSYELKKALQTSASVLCDGETDDRGTGDHQGDGRLIAFFRGEIKDRRPAYASAISSYMVHHPRCELFVACAECALSGDEGVRGEIIKKLNSFKDPTDFLFDGEPPR